MNSETTDLDLDMVEAGRLWKTSQGVLDNRVWWPVVTLASRDDAEAVLESLRAIEGSESPRLRRGAARPAEARGAFELTVGDFSGACWSSSAGAAGRRASILDDVPIGRGFHWERKERLEYRGDLRLFRPAAGLTATNRLPLETYLESAVGSEMRSDLPPAFSQAQAIAARSTVLATANRHHRADGFDVCNDDHCQCYQGTQREADAVVAPVREPPSVFLPVPRVVDARYAKSCGGASERYEAAWGEEGPDYFAVRPCGDFGARSDARRRRPPLSRCAARLLQARCIPIPIRGTRIRSSAGTSAHPRGVGPLLLEKTGHRVGALTAFHVKQRGKSGRILLLEIGSAGRTTIYGELNIRRALSHPHLPSSYFVADEHGDTITLKGGGWGHGVGLCQLGAAAMAQKGWSVARSSITIIREAPSPASSPDGNRIR